MTGRWSGGLAATDRHGRGLAKSVLAGFGQVYLLNNPLAGAAFVLAIASNSPAQAANAAIGAMVGTLGAKACALSEDEIRDGLFSFNGVLIGIALSLHLHSPLSSAMLTLVCSAAAVVMAVSMRRALQLPYYTMPFVVLTWLIIAAFPSSQPGAGAVSGGAIDFVDATLNGIGQVLLQTGPVPSALVIVALALANPLAACLAVLISAAAALAGASAGISSSWINGGLLAYNSILAVFALRLAGHGLPDVLMGGAAAFALAWLFLLVGVPPYTAPFVMSAWLMHLARRRRSAPPA